MGRPGELITREAAYVRHRTRCLVAGLEGRTGQVLILVTPRRPATVFTAFLDRLDAQVPGSPATTAWRRGLGPRLDASRAPASIGRGGRPRRRAGTIRHVMRITDSERPPCG